MQLVAADELIYYGPIGRDISIIYIWYRYETRAVARSGALISLIPLISRIIIGIKLGLIGSSGNL